MSPLAIGLAFTGLLLLLILLRLPVAIAMLAAAIGGIVAIQGWTAAAFQLGAVPYGATAYGLSVIPLFVLMGALAARTGLARDLYDAGNAVVGQVRGGLAMGTLVGCAGFSTICGSSLATAATMGGVSLSEMARHGYDRSLSAGAVAAGGTVGILIPPSVILVIYAIMTEQSVSQLFAAGVVPGIVLTGLFVATVAVWVRLRPDRAPPAQPVPLSQRFAALRGVWPLIVLLAVVIGGIYTGLFTPTESAGIGAFGTGVIGALRRKLNRQLLMRALVESAVTSAMIFLIIFGSSLFSTFLTVTGLTQALRGLTADSGLPPLAVLILMLGILVVLGCFMDSLGIILLTVPVFFPVVVDLGYDPVWYGILLVMVVEMGLITPPVGMNVFVVRGVAPDIPIGCVFAGVLPFLFAFVIAIASLIAAPGLALWLPGLVP